jgi:hypothetical protein
LKKETKTFFGKTRKVLLSLLAKVKLGWRKLLASLLLLGLGLDLFGHSSKPCSELAGLDL